MQEVTEKTRADLGAPVMSNPLGEHAIKDVDAMHAIAGAMQAVEDRLMSVAKASGSASDAIVHLISSGGKRIRPRLTLLIAGTCHDFSGTFPVDLAAASELIHSASLLHDDVIDEGVQRRGIPTSRVVYSNTVSVLAGDHCLSSAVELIRAFDPGDVLAESLRAVQDLVNGELLQLKTRGTLQVDEEHYRQICLHKTASLFVWAARAGARSANATPRQLDAVGNMARNLGLAFQMRDDLLDITGDQRFGKRLLDDLREGRMTLPVIYAVQCNPALADELQKMFEGSVPSTTEALNVFRGQIEETGAIERVADEVWSLTREALDDLFTLPRTPYRDLIESQIEMLGSREI